MRVCVWEKIDEGLAVKSVCQAMRRVDEQSVRLSDTAKAQVSPDAVQGKVIVRQGMGREGWKLGDLETWRGGDGWLVGGGYAVRRGRRGRVDTTT